jgi:uncharacterized protein YndB with AHSA1/START domain
MSKPKFVYVVYIASTPEQVFKALTDSKMSHQYWFGYAVTSDWKVGGSFALTKDGKTTHPGKVLAYDPPCRLSYTFHPDHSGVENEAPSRVTFELEAVNGQVRLTVVHDEFEDGSKVFGMIQVGWPSVLSSLKSLLETGKPLPPAITLKQDDEVREGVRS